MAIEEYHKDHHGWTSYWLADDEIAQAEKDYFETAAETEAECDRFDAELEEWREGIRQDNEAAARKPVYRSHLIKDDDGYAWLDVREAEPVTLDGYSI